MSNSENNKKRKKIHHGGDHSKKNKSKLNQVDINQNQIILPFADVVDKCFSLGDCDTTLENYAPQDHTIEFTPLDSFPNTIPEQKPLDTFEFSDDDEDETKVMEKLKIACAVRQEVPSFRLGRINKEKEDELSDRKVIGTDEKGRNFYQPSQRWKVAAGTSMKKRRRRKNDGELLKDKILDKSDIVTRDITLQEAQHSEVVQNNNSDQNSFTVECDDEILRDINLYDDFSKQPHNKDEFFKLSEEEQERCIAASCKNFLPSNEDWETVAKFITCNADQDDPFRMPRLLEIE